jgi:Ca2+-binding RTX toxin-like protein
LDPLIGVAAQQDVIASATAGQTLNGNSGNDLLFGNDGDDTINGGAGTGSDLIIGGNGADVINGGSGNDVIDGGAGGDILVGNADADAIDTGAANDDIQDIVRFGSTLDYNDTINNFDVTGTLAQADRVEFFNPLNLDFDDIIADDNFQFGSGEGADGGNTSVNLNTSVEALFLAGTNGEGVTGANLGVASAIVTEFNAEFAITAAASESARLVVYTTDTNSFSLWQYTENGAANSELAITDLVLIGIFNGNGDAVIGQFDFV